MSKLRITLIVAFAILSFICTSMGALARLEHWPYWVDYVALALGLLLGGLVVVLLLVRSKAR